VEVDGRIMIRRVLGTLLLLALAALPARAFDRGIFIVAPAEVRPGGAAQITVSAFTDATDGEQIGFLHSEYSVDGGKTWVGISFQESAGTMFERTVHVTAGPAGSKIFVRLKVAFRGGKAGDVDYRSQPVDWDGRWSRWLAPPARVAVIYVR
jgi:hypothetical protein